MFHDLKDRAYILRRLTVRLFDLFATRYPAAISAYPTSQISGASLRDIFCGESPLTWRPGDGSGWPAGSAPRRWCCWHTRAPGQAQLGQTLRYQPETQR